MIEIPRKKSNQTQQIFLVRNIQFKNELFDVDTYLESKCLKCFNEEEMNDKKSKYKRSRLNRTF